MNQNGREMNLPASRVLHQTERKYPTQLSREEIMQTLHQVADRRLALAGEIDLEGVWELAVDEEHGDFSPLFLSELCFGTEAGDDQVAAFLQAVFADRFFFKFRDGKILVHSREVVRQLREREEKERQLAEVMEQGARGLQAIMAGDAVADWPGRDRCLDLVRQHYLFGNEAPEAELARDLLKKAGLAHPHDPYYLLIKAGIWQQDENVPLHRLDVPVDFEAKQLELAEKLAAGLGGNDFHDGDRLDLRDLPLMTIDGEFTRDFDDALHVERKGEDFLVGIHIADVSAFIKPGDELFLSARKRGTSIYFPDRQIPMLPKILSEGACSLIEGENRPGLSFLVHLTARGEVVDFKVTRSVVRVKRRISYSQAEKLLAAGQDAELKVLADLSLRLQERRVENGALIIPIPDVNISINGNGRVQVHLGEVDTPARTLVAEFMVLANMLGAQYFADRQIPALYRCQEPPRQRLAPGVQKDLFVNFRQRRFLSRGQLLSEPKAHSGVGASQYTTLTSPIRRLLDLAMQQQLSHVLQGKGPLYSGSDCRDLGAAILEAQSRVNQARQFRHRYWLFKYLAQEAGSGNRLDALVLEIQPRRIQVVLTDILLEGDLPLNQGPKVSPGDRIKVKLGKANALDNTFRLEW
ncbi:MAG: RNB domain-containing ribonuclease [Deltaproteobacteria bacterium]|nr:RNB domain-containing ribonuclease [Deltaproteobacteria bacterium]